MLLKVAACVNDKEAWQKVYFFDQSNHLQNASDNARCGCVSMATDSASTSLSN